MTELAWLMAALTLGCAVGGAYFATLWATVLGLPVTRHPALLVFGSFAVRFGAAALVLVVIVHSGGLSWIASALTGFVLARIVIVRRLLPANPRPQHDAA